VTIVQAPPFSLDIAIVVISEAGHAENVAALAYVSGFEPEKGERAGNRCAWEYTPGRRA